MIPQYPITEDAGKNQYIVTSWWRRIVSNYTGLTFLEVGELDYLQYLIWRRDAFIYFMSQTEAGEEYLNNAWRMEQTEPDRPALRKKLGKGG